MLVVLALIAVVTIKEALPALRAEGFSFLLSKRWAPNEDVFGALSFIFGTVFTTTIALVMSVPVSIGVALFTTEIAPSGLKRPVIYLVDLLAAVPSVVYGLWGVLVLAPVLTKFYRGVSEATSGLGFVGRFFGEPVSGRSFATAGLILGVMITPIITSIAREVFATVPSDQRDGAWALGATRWEVIRGVVLVHGRAGVFAGAMLGLGRAMGETIAAALVIGSTPQLVARIFAPGDSMAAVIANQFGEAAGTHRSALIGLGVVLFVVILLVNVVGRALIARSAVRSLGAAA